VPAGVRAVDLRIPPDRANGPWKLLVRARGRTTVCPLA
jgi:hypothetical protein